MKYVAGQDLALPSESWTSEVDMNNSIDPWNAYVLCPLCKVVRNTGCVELAGLEPRSPGWMSPGSFPSLLCNVGSMRHSYLPFENMRPCKYAEIMNGTMMDRWGLKAGVSGCKLSWLSWCLHPLALGPALSCWSWAVPCADALQSCLLIFRKEPPSSAPNSLKPPWLTCK